MIGDDRGAIRLEVEDDPDLPLGQPVVHQLDDMADAVIERGGFGPRLPRPGEIQKIVDDPLDAPEAVVAELQVFPAELKSQK